MNQPATTAPSRDPFLDCLKGFAIATVVLGHTFQGATPDFDHYLPFRLVYSFHMPMFMFVAGMTASFGVSRWLNTELNFLSYAYEIRSKALRLLLPFVTWAVIQYFMIRPEGYGPATWLLHVFQSPDSGLWFLLTLFQCSCVLALVSIAVQFASRRLAARRPSGTSNSATLYLTLIVAGLLANVLIRLIPLSATFVPKLYFIYFFAGVVFHITRPAGLASTARWIPYVIFLALAPFWYRTEISPIALLFKHPRLADSAFRYLVAFAGTLAFVDFAHLFANEAPALLARAVAYLGKRSLDVYAIHFYFLAYFPPVIAPIAISLGVSLILRTNFVTSWLCVGQRPLNVWRIIRDRFPIITSRRSGITDKAVMISRE
ncbi:acyltransferase family protein [Bradyrhizobium sp.]|uniref:acyltransferase family protein n=1 Tax=Bradyrhizobium sp. TaxID=376 RepID=UPI003C643EA3